MSKAEVLKAIQGLTLRELLEVVEVASGRLRQLISANSQTEEIHDESISPAQWQSAVMTNPSFAFLNDPAEDIYTLEDGQPVSEELSTQHEG